LERIAQELGLGEATLKEWVHRWGEDRLEVRNRGRKCQESGAWMRNVILALIGHIGPEVSVTELQEIFPEAARRELEDLLRRYRQSIWKKRKVIFALRWVREGAVWAIDLTEPPEPVDGRYPYILVVRDLASGKQLLVLPLPDKRARTVRDALLVLVREFGPPLAIKSDNGSEFLGEETRGLLDEHQIVALLSPPCTPSYNGAVEAGIGGLKVRAHHESARHDRPGQWTSDDVEAARLLGNATPRTWVRRFPVPNRAWERRSAIRQDERQEFQDMVEQYREIAHVERGFLPGLVPGPRDCASIDRYAITRALLELGYLKIRRRRITLPFCRSRRRNIS
jgi:transposase InsO family protein